MKWNTNDEGADVATELDQRVWPWDTAVVSQASDGMWAATLSSTNTAYEALDIGRYGSREQANASVAFAVGRAAGLDPGETIVLGPDDLGIVTVIGREVNVVRATLAGPVGEVGIYD